MKKFIFSAFLMALMIAGAQAQSSGAAKACCSKGGSANAAACESKVASVSATDQEAYAMAAAKLASTDASIETRTSATDGQVSYVRKTSQPDGSVSFVDVTYDATTQSFVEKTIEAKPTSAKAAKACCAGKTGGSKSCCSGAKASAPVQ